MTNQTSDNLGAQSRVVELAATIHAKAEEIEEYLRGHDLPFPSFDIGSPEDLPLELRTEQHALLEAADELVALVSGPRRYLAEFAYEHNKTTSLHAIIRFDLANAFPLSTSTTFAQLASSSGLSEQDIAQILRHAMTYHIFEEPVPGVIMHTAASRLLASSPNLSCLIEVALDELLPSATRLVDAMQQWPNSPEPNHSGFNLANDTSEPIFTVMDKSPERATKFANSMKGFLEAPPFSPEHLVKNYEWGDVKKVVDIGGSSGSVGMALAKAFQGLLCIVQDLPQAIETAEIPHHLKDRVKLSVHDMFDEQTILDADVYLIRFVLHDWSDYYVAKVLRRLVPALENAQTGKRRILINDTCLPDWGSISLFDQRMMRATSLTMRAIQNGKERDVEDWKRVIRLADSRLHLKNVTRPKGSALCILVVELE